MKRRALAGAALLPWTLAQAQELPQTVAVVQIVAAAPLAGLGVERDLLPYALQQLGRAQLGQAQGNTLGESLRSLVGVNTNDIAGSPFQSDLSYRGFRASPVLGTAQGISVYLDSVRVNEPFGDVINWDLLPDSAIDAVMLVPGSNPVYGLNTIGGALALTTKSGFTQPGFEVEASTSNGRRRRLDLAYGASDEQRRHVFVAASVLNDAGWRAYSPAHLLKVFAKAGQKTGRQSWELSLLGAASRLQGNGLLPDALFATDRRAAYTAPDSTRNRLLQASATYSQHLDRESLWSLMAYVRHSRRDSVNGDLGEDYADYLGQGAEGAPPPAAELNTTSTRQRSHGLSSQWSGERGAHQWQLGASFDRSQVSYAQFSRPGEFDARRIVTALPDEAPALAASVVGNATLAGVYASDLMALGEATHLNYSARWNHAVVSNTLTTDTGPQPQERFVYQRLNPALGLTHRLGGQVTLFANLAQSSRVPTVIELGCADPLQPCRLPVGLQSDPYLKQVVARTSEAGLRWQVRGASVSATIYRTASKDDILFFSSGVTHQGYFANFARTLHQGVDVAADYRLGPVALHAGYSLLDATYDAAGVLAFGMRSVAVEPGTRIAGLPRHTLKLGMDWAAGAIWDLGARLQATSSLGTQGNEDGRRAGWRVSGFAVLGVHANYRPNAHWQWYARIDNVLDRRYANFGAIAPDFFPQGRLLQAGGASPAAARFVAPGAPRSVAAGLQIHF
ncbi:MAG: TonB-dependent receptor [Pseudomonadota bacterium]